jgi:hypothetical protein
MKIYERKLHTETNSLDLDSGRAIRKSLNSSERQRGRKELEEQLPPQFFTYSREWNELNNPYPHEHRDDWRGYKPFSECTIGGRFLTVLTKLELIPSLNRGWAAASDRRIVQDTHYLYEKLAVAPDGYVYIGPKENIQVMKLDIPTSVTLGSKLK